MVDHAALNRIRHELNEIGQHSQRHSQKRYDSPYTAVLKLWLASPQIAIISARCSRDAGGVPHDSSSRGKMSRPETLALCVLPAQKAL